MNPITLNASPSTNYSVIYLDFMQGTNTQNVVFKIDHEERQKRYMINVFFFIFCK